MLILTRNRSGRLSTLGALYFAQGLSNGFIAVIFVKLLADLGLSNSTLGAALGITYLPALLKVVFGPALDRSPVTKWGRRRPFIIAAELGMGATILALLLFDLQRQLHSFIAVLFVHLLFRAMQDAAVDGLAIDILKPSERGIANGLMWACLTLGITAAGYGGLLIQQWLGLSTLLAVIAIAMLCIMALIVLVREHTPDRERASSEEVTSTGWAELKRSFGSPTSRLGLLASVSIIAGVALTPAVFGQLLHRGLRFTSETTQTLVVVDIIAQVVGALLGGFIADRVGVRKTMGGFMGLTAVSMLAFGFLLFGAPTPMGVGVFVALNSSAFYAFYTASFSFFMTMSNPKVGATQFAVFMAASNLTLACCSALGGAIAQHAGASTLFFVAAAVQLIAISILPYCDPSKAKSHFDTEGDSGDLREGAQSHLQPSHASPGHYT